MIHMQSRVMKATKAITARAKGKSGKIEVLFLVLGMDGRAGVRGEWKGQRFRQHKSKEQYGLPFEGIYYALDICKFG